MSASVYDVAVIGGGASGLAAAITAARAGALTCVIERDVQAGLGLLATGNGRCNVSNAHLDPARYLHPSEVLRVMGAHPERDVAALFESVGVLFAEEDEGRLYPITRRAESIRDALLNACEREGVELLCCADLASHTRPDASGTHRLELELPARPLAHKRGRDAKAEVRNARKALVMAERARCAIDARAVIVACGGSSEAVCRMLDVPHLAERPVLCPIACALDLPRSAISAHEQALAHLDGLRAEAALDLMRDGAHLARERGEVLFRPYGISGIAAFNLSRRIQPGDEIALDLVPTIDECGLSELLRQREHTLGPFAGDARWFDGLLARPFAELITCALRGANDPLSRAAQLLHHLPLQVKGTTEHAQAHVRRGGIPLDALDLDTLAVRRAAATPSPAPMRLFACGESLDVDADCGGYNLAWAWISGMRAGASAARATAAPR